MTIFPRLAVALSLAAASLIAPAAQAGNKPPVTGSWSRVTVYLATVSGSACPSSFKPGLSTAGQVYFAGGGNTGSLLYLYAPGSSTTTADIYKVALPVMPASNGGTTSGSASVTDLQSNLTLNGSLQMTLSYATPASFFLQANGTFTFIVSCTLGLNMTGLQTGT
jgi:hypothetical protein